MNVFSRYRIASVFALLAVSGATFAQVAVNEEAVFDDAPPSLADNLPPDPSAATSELSEMAADGAAPQETMTQTHQSIIGEAMRPFNSRLEKKKLREQGFTPLPDWRDALHRYVKLLREEA